MKGEKVRALFRKSAVKIASVTLAAAVAIGSSMMYENTLIRTAPQLVLNQDGEGTMVIQPEESPIAAPKVTKSTKTKKTTKNIKLKKASKKSYTKTDSNKKKKTTKRTSTSKATTTTETVVQTTVKSKYTKKSKVRKQTTTVKTTVTKTVVAKAPAAQQTVQNGVVKCASIAPKLDQRVTNAFEQLGFEIVVNSNVTYSGLFDARSQSITLKKADATVYHEMGHFVAFAAGNVDMSPAFQQVFAKEKSLYTAFNKGYVLSSSAEYFAESFKNYTENPAELKKSRPETYLAIQSAVEKLTPAQISKLSAVYGAIWK